MALVVCPQCGLHNSEFNPRCRTCNALLPPSSAGISHESSAAGEVSPPFDPKESLVGRRIEHFQVTELLGRGGMGEVYRAYDDSLERPVALKIIRSDRSENDEMRQRFQREARAAERLDHPAIVRIFEVFQHGTRDCIVMELVEGRTLSDLLESAPVDLLELVSLARQVAEGLAVAHACGIVHRDLKADNVMVTRACRAKILDFGLAKRFSFGDSDSLSEVSLTVDGGVVGTFRAMSPEQAQGHKVDHRSDFFSLGTLVYEATTGKSPFGHGGIAATLAQLCIHRQTPACEVNPAIPETLSALIDWLMEKNRDDRPQNAGEVVAAFEDVLVELGSASEPMRS